MFFRKKADDAPPFLNELEKKIYLQKKQEMESRHRDEMKSELKVLGVLSTMASGIGMGLDVMLTGGLGGATVMFTSCGMMSCAGVLVGKKGTQEEQADILIYDVRQEAFRREQADRLFISQPPPVKPSNAALLKLAFTPQEKTEKSVEETSAPSPSKVKKNVL